MINEPRDYISGLLEAFLADEGRKTGAVGREVSVLRTSTHATIKGIIGNLCHFDLNRYGYYLQEGGKGSALDALQKQRQDWRSSLSYRDLRPDSEDHVGKDSLVVGRIITVFLSEDQSPQDTSDQQAATTAMIKKILDNLTEDDFNHYGFDLLKASKVSAFNALRKQRPDWRPNLSNTDLSKTNLDGVNLTGARLSDTKFSSTSFVGAQLDGANLTGAFLFRANLTGASLVKVRCVEAGLDEAILTESDCRNSNFGGSFFTGAKVNGANFSGCFLVETEIARVDFSAAVTTDANFYNAYVSESIEREVAGGEV